MKPQYFSKEELNFKEVAKGIKSWGVSLEHVKMTYFELEPNSVFKMNSDSHEQISMVVEGELFLRIGKQEAKVQKGEVFALPVGVECIIRTEKQGAKAVDAWVMISGEEEEDLEYDDEDEQWEEDN